MPIQLSPGVQVIEKDFTQIVPSVSTTRGAVVGNFKWGPVLQPTLITSDTELVKIFSTPDDNNYESFYTTTNFLAYSNNLLVTRADTGPSRNAVSVQSSGIDSLNIIGGGAGYRAVPDVFFSAPALLDGTPATATAVLSGGPISTFAITTAGLGYVVGDVVVLPAPAIQTLVSGTYAFDQATAVVATINGSGGITSVTITHAGAGYFSTIINPIVGDVTSSLGVSAVINFTATASYISDIILESVGSGYTSTQAVSVFIEALPNLQNPAEITTKATAIAIVISDSIKVKNNTHYDQLVSDQGLSCKGEFIAKYPGALGNTLSVSLCDASNWLTPATGTVYTRSAIESQENSRELIIARINGVSVSAALSFNELDAGKVLRTSTSGMQKLVGEVDFVDTTSIYRKVELNSKTVASLRSKSIKTGDTDVYIETTVGSVITKVKVGTIDGLYKSWNRLNHVFEISKTVLYIRLSDITLKDIHVGDILKTGIGETIGVVKSVANSVVVYLKTPAPTNIYGESFSAEWKYKYAFARAPGTSAFAALNNGSNDEIHVAIVDTLGQLAPIGTILEKYQHVSKGSDAKTDGLNNYYRDVINSSSSWVRWSDHPTGSDVDSLFVNTFRITPVTYNITAFSNYNATVAGTVKATSNAHGLTGTSSQVISGSTNFNGTYTVTVVDANNFYFTHAWVSLSAESGTFVSNSGYHNPGDVIIVPNKGLVSLSSGGYLSFTPASNWDLTPISVAYTTTKNVNNIITASVTEDIPSVFVSNNLLDTSGVIFGSSVIGNRFKNLSNIITRQLSGGVDTIKSDTTNGNLMEGYDLYAQSELYDISLIPVGNASEELANYVIQNVAEYRKDCVAFISPPLLIGTESSIATQISTFRDAIVSSSYGVLDSTWKYQYDKYNDKYRWIPMNGDTAGLCASTDQVADPWFSPGGFSRGIIKNIIKVAFNPNQEQRDVLYSNGINPIVTFPGQGSILYGDKTLLKTPSAFDRINVRRLFIVLEKAISKASKYQLFEFNDEFTRAQFKNIVEPFLRDVQGRRGITEFMVRCDESNNTPQVIDSNQFIADIYIKPNRSINFITLNFIAAKTGASFQELGI